MPIDLKDEAKQVSNFKNLSGKQKATLIAMAVAVLISILTVIFMFQSLKKVTFDRTKLERLEAEQATWQRERAGYVAERQSIQRELEQRKAVDSALAADVANSDAIITSLRAKINKISSDEKNTPPVRTATTTDIQRYIADEAARIRAGKGQ